MAQSAIASDVHQSLDVHLDFTAHCPFDLVVGLDDGANRCDFFVVELAHLLVDINTGLGKNLSGARFANAEDVRQANFCPLISW
jgi:hypothetical protein